MQKRLKVMVLGTKEGSNEKGKKKKTWKVRGPTERKEKRQGPSGEDKRVGTQRRRNNKQKSPDRLGRHVRSTGLKRGKIDKKTEPTGERKEGDDQRRPPGGERVKRGQSG